MFILDDDVLVFIDFRADRMRQIVEAFGVKQHFETAVVPKNLVSVANTFFCFSFCLMQCY